MVVRRSWKKKMIAENKREVNIKNTAYRYSTWLEYWVKGRPLMKECGGQAVNDF